MVEANHQEDVDGDEPSEARHTVEDAPQTALLARQSGQLSVRTVQQVGKTKQQDADEVKPESLPPFIVEAAVQEKDTAERANEHGSNRDGIGMDAQLGKEHRHKIAHRTNQAIVKPILRLRGLQGCQVFLFQLL